MITFQQSQWSVCDVIAVHTVELTLFLAHWVLFCSPICIAHQQSRAVHNRLRSSHATCIYKVGCVDAKVTLKSTINCFAQRGSSVFVALLDISKAFDSVNHFKLYSSLLRMGIPVMITDVLCDWYSKLSYAVKWNGAISEQFAVGSDVRQGSCLCLVMLNCISLYISVFRCLCLPDWRINVFIYRSRILVFPNQKSWWNSTWVNPYVGTNYRRCR